MNVKDKLKRLTGSVKRSKVRYISVYGVNYAVGIGYIVELTRRYNERYGVDASIDEVLQDCFGNAKVTADAIERIALALSVSMTHYNRSVDGSDVSIEDVIAMIDERGFGYIGKVILAISSTITAMMVAGMDDKKDEKAEPEQKKS